MTVKPLISVIIPTFNRLGFLKEAIESVEKQSCRDFELIVVDDGSTDGTEAYLENLPLKYIRLEHSGFPGRVRNAGARAAAGKYLSFLDSDDLWEPEKLARQKEYLAANPKIELCHTRELWLRNNRVVSQSKQRHKREGDIFKHALKKCIIGPSTVMLSSRLFNETGGFREDMEIAEDYELWLRLTNSYDVGYIDEPLVIKRGGHGDQLSEKYGQIEIFRIKALQENLEEGSFQGENKILAGREMARKCRIYGSGALKRGKKEQGEYYLRLAERWGGGSSGD
ncbi:MAG: glycosyltransferase [Spirochaeta sp.]|nr:glycosyltransferase [Spirochaeta sp.]